MAAGYFQKAAKVNAFLWANAVTRPEPVSLTSVLAAFTCLGRSVKSTATRPGRMPGATHKLVPPRLRDVLLDDGNVGRVDSGVGVDIRAEVRRINRLSDPSLGLGDIG